ncbi:acetyltransferase [Actinotalea ferrariae CF5-4]|uniref:Acetyltransferase n=1 Tax=Actinotalea ferrariae CF5-4 TaxID=948458 RepID=A0A021VU05_9CELL|nr:GNAT family protein [Actinotalea ferrariae]EYR64608.1 acetyltransferase [Actinotalea ferrariae CF5-4]
MHPVTLGDDVVTLSVPTVEDVDAITAICQDPEIQEWTTVPSPYRREHAVGFVEDLVRSGWEDDRERNWAVRVDGRLVGMVGLGRRPLRCAEVGFWMAPDARGRGLLDRALRLVLDHAFDPGGMDLERVEWKAFAGNWRSWRAVWRHGFRFEGALRRGGVHRDARRDDWVGGLLRDDPREPVLPWPGTVVDPLGTPPA